MAGIIEFTVGSWGSSGGTFRAIAAGVMQHLVEDEASTRLIAVLGAALNSNLLYLHFGRDLDETMRAAFESALCRYAAEAKARGAAASESPDLYPGFVERLDELVTMIGCEPRSAASPVQWDESPRLRDDSVR